MKQIVATAAAFILSGVAHAAPVTSFHAKDYIACDAHSMGAVRMANDAVHRKQPVEAVLNDRYKTPDVLDVKLSLLASDAIKAGYLDSADERSLQRFLTGVCYESGLKGKQPALNP